jgi:hypothetical protein
MTDAEMLAEALRDVLLDANGEIVTPRFAKSIRLAREALAAYESRKAQGPTLAESHGKTLRPFYCSCVGLDPTCPEHGPNPEPGRFGEGAIAQGMREAMRAEAKSLCPSCGRHAYEYSTPCSNCPDCRGGGTK